MQNTTHKCVFPRIELNTVWPSVLHQQRSAEITPLNVGKKLAHETRTAITIVHLLLLHPLEGLCDERI